MSAKAKPAANGKAAPPQPLPDVLTPVQAAAYLQLPPDAVRAEADAGRLPGRCVAGEWRFSRSALLNWLNAPAPWPPPAPFGPWTPEAEREAEAEIARLAAARRGEPKRGRVRSRAE